MTLTIAGSRQIMAKDISTSPRSNFQLTAKMLNLNTVPVFPPGYAPKLQASPAANCSSERGSEANPSGMSALPITLQTSCCDQSSGATRDCINCPMNIVSRTPEPYLEPIKLLNKQSVEERQQSPAAARSTVGVPSAESTAAGPKLRQVTRSCFTGTKFPSPSSRPIPPPKVLLKRQPSTRETASAPVRSKQAARKARVEFSPTSAKKRELAYLIVDLESGRTAIGTKNNRALDDSNVGLRVKSDEKFKFPVRSYTMSIPGDQVKRPVVKPRPTRYTSSDSIKEEFAESADVVETVSDKDSPCGLQTPESVSTETSSLDALREHPVIRVTSSVGAGERREGEGTTVSTSERNHQTAPPPVPPKRGLAKMVSLPPGSNGGATIGSRLQRNGRPSLPASGLIKDLQAVNAKFEGEPRLPSPNEKPADTSTVGQKPVRNRLPPPKPKPYSERIVSPPPPPPPSFPPPPRPTATSAAKPTSPPASRKSPSPLPQISRRVSSPVPPPKSLAASPSQTNLGLKSSHSHQSLAPPGASSDQNGAAQRNRLPSDSKTNKPKRPKPPPPSRPPPANSKLTQLIQEHRSRSKSVAGGKGQSSPATAKLKLEISEPKLISTTMRSDSQSLTDLKNLQDRDVEEESRDNLEEDEEGEDDLIACSNISYISTSELLLEDNPSPLYEDIDSVIPLPPPRTDAVKSTGVKKSLSTDSLPPELPPKDNCHSDPIGRRRRMRRTPPVVLPKAQPVKTLNTNGSVERPLPSPDSPTDDNDVVEPYYVKRMSGNSDEEDEGSVQDTGTYEPIRSPLLDDGEEGEEPDVGGVEEYVMMGSVISGAWETDDKENSGTLEDRPEDSYVEMQPVSVTSPSPSGLDYSRNTYELDDDEPEPVYIEMSVDDFVEPPKNQLHYASKNLLTNRPDLQAKNKKKSKKLFGLRKR